MGTVKYSDYLADSLVELGYTHCFFVAGGNIMHLLESCDSRFICTPVVHEVTAVIAAEYFNQHGAPNKAFALVTAGPGLTNAVTGIAGAWLESRPVLVVGGQVKSSDLTGPGLRQRGIQEVDGVSLVSSITKSAVRLSEPVHADVIRELDENASAPRCGPVFLEVCLDVQAAQFEAAPLSKSSQPRLPDASVDVVLPRVKAARRPVLLLGGGISREVAERVAPGLDRLGIPILTTWNGADRYASDRPMWFGRPDTWGMRGSNLILQHADLVVALGCRLSLQQTGFNWQAFVPFGQVLHVDLDVAELEKAHPARRMTLHGDANRILELLAGVGPLDSEDWVARCNQIFEACPLNDPSNSTHPGFHSPYEFVDKLSGMCTSQDSVVPCSSGGANTVMMQAFRNKTGQRFFNNKALASMGYGLAGAIGASYANVDGRVILVEGDGGFAQNLQELAIVSANQLNIKIFIFENNGYASIRSTQSNYFGGRYIGCDASTGLASPDWKALADAYSLEFLVLGEDFESDDGFGRAWDGVRPALFVVPVHTEQTYYPKISSRVMEDGSMESAPLDAMSPPAPKAAQHAVALLRNFYRIEES